MHTDEVDDLHAWIASRDWYHTIELAPGVVTPGWFDLRTTAVSVLPPSLHGKRCLDVGTFDGFWSFEMERRGAAEVVACDEIEPIRWDWPSGSSQEVMAQISSRHQGSLGFARVRQQLRSEVEHVHCNVYDLEPRKVGTFDFVYVGSLLNHLRDPVRALEAVRGICRADAEVLVLDAIDLELTLLFPRRPLAQLDGIGRPWWWKPNLAGLARMVSSAGFTVSTPRRIFMPPGRGQHTVRPSLRELRHAQGRAAAVMHGKGDPHGLVVARVAEPLSATRLP